MYPLLAAAESVRERGFTRQHRGSIVGYRHRVIAAIAEPVADAGFWHRQVGGRLPYHGLEQVLLGENRWGDIWDETGN